MIDHNATDNTTDTLSHIFQSWTHSQGLPALSADELIHEDLTPYQRRWVSEFILAWEANERAARWVKEQADDPAYQLARLFCYFVQDDPDLREHLPEVIRRNATPEYAGCDALHDFCDANEIMAAAFVESVGHEPDSNSARDAYIWNRAWNMARGMEYNV